MSGRDWRRFVTGHRQGKTLNFSHKKEDELVLAIISGSTRPKHFSQVNYDQVLATIKEKKEESKAQSLRVNRLAKLGKERKKESLLNEHRKYWIKTCTDLKQKVAMCQLEMEQWQSNCVLNEPTLCLKEPILEIIELTNDLQIKRSHFQVETQEPIRQLRKELWHYKRSSEKPFSLKEKIICKMKELKESQKKEWLHLEAEWILLSDELQSFQTEINSNTIESFEISGVPNEVQSLECPNDELRENITEEFTQLDTHYQNELIKLDKQLKECLSGYNGGFHVENDRLHFELIYEQYPSTERSLCIDRMMIEMPHKTRQEIVCYEMQYCAVKYYRKQKELIERSWEQGRRELIRKTIDCFDQASRDWEGRKMIEKERANHHLMCMKLAEKVSEWRQKRLAVQEAEALEAASKMAKQKALMEEEEKREQEKRTVIKEKLAQFHAQTEQNKLKEVTKEKERIEKRRIELELQLQVDKKRTEYRSSLYEKKLQDQHSMREALEEENEKKEERLERLRKLVRIEANSDPERICSDTKSSKARLIKSEEANLTDPLFQMNSFTSDKIMTDKRLKVAEALREAGLLSSDYAKKILATIPPPIQPRPDQYSSLFKHDK